MTTYSKLNFIYRLQKWMDSVPGQTFLNYAYSWGASIVILGTLFKLTHLPGANFFLFLGMGTEVFVFFIAAFDRPFDKTTDGMELDVHPGEEPAVSAVAGNGVTGGGVVGGGTVIINGGGGSTVGSVVGNGEEASRWEGGSVNIGGGAVIASQSVQPVQQPIEQPMAEELKDATSNYIEELNRLTEMLTQVSEQSKRLTRDSEEMDNLNRTLTGISRVYEMQLKSASSQISTSMRLTSRHATWQSRLLS